MRILVTNDDGFRAPGLVALVDALGEIQCDITGKTDEILVVAPDRECSATGHGITVHRPLRAEPIRLGCWEVQGWAVEGTPADCVKLALDFLLTEPPDVVVSGINRGPNLGTDILYSGTVSGALEGAIHGIPSLAVSLASFTDNNYQTAAMIARDLVVRIVAGEFPPDILLNVNVPALPPEKLRGIRVTRLGTRRWQNVFEKRCDPRGRVYYWLAGDAVDAPGEAGTDVEAVSEGFTSITPVHFDLTDYKVMEAIRNSLEDRN